MLIGCDHCSFLASKEHKRQEQEQRENALKQQVGKLETEIRAKELSYQRLHSSLQTTVQLLKNSRYVQVRWTMPCDLAPRQPLTRPQRHVHFAYSNSRAMVTASQFQELPAVLVMNVLSYLDGSGITNAACMHRNWYVIAMCDSFWKEIYALRWHKSDAKQGVKRVHAFASKYLGSNVVPSLQSNPQTKPTKEEAKSNDTEQIEWMALYRERHVVERNWANGKATITTLNGHNGTVTCLQFSESRLVSGSDDGSMMLWSLLPRQEGETAALNWLESHSAVDKQLCFVFCARFCFSNWNFESECEWRSCIDAATPPPAEKCREIALVLWSRRSRVGIAFPRKHVDQRVLR